MELPKDALPFHLRGRIWALHNHPYLPFRLFSSPFCGAMTSLLSTPPEQISLDEDVYGLHLPQDVSKSWRALEMSCLRLIAVLRDTFKKQHPDTPFTCVVPEPTFFGYSKCYRNGGKARTALSHSIDAFALLFACVSFYIAICDQGDTPCITSSSSTSTHPEWFQRLSNSPEFSQLLADSSISDFTSTQQRTGVIVNVASCSWFNLVPYLLKVNIPVWFYWGTAPNFLQPLNANALIFAPRAHPQWRARKSQPVGLPTPSQSASLPNPAQSAGLPTASQSVSLRSGQLPGEHWKDFLARQDLRRKKKLSNENEDQRKRREDREKAATKRSCPGKKGPTVYLWEKDNGVWNRTLISRGQVERDWSMYPNSHTIYNSVDNCWDVCSEFDVDTAGEVEYDSNNSDNDIYHPPAKQPRRSPTPKNGRSEEGSARPPNAPQISSDLPSEPMLLDTTPAQIASAVVGSSLPVSSPAQVASDPLSIAVDPTPAPALMPAQVALDPLSTAVGPTLPVSSPGQVALDSLSMAVDSASLPASSPAQVASNPLPMVVDTTPPSVSLPGQAASDSTAMAVDLTPLPASSPAQVASDPLHTVVETTPISASLPEQVASDPLPTGVDLTPPPVSSPAQVVTHKDDEGPYAASREGALNASHDLELTPITALDDLLYYRYGFSLNENPYTGIPSSYKAGTFTFRNWTEVCRSVGGQGLEKSALNGHPIEDFLSILAVCDKPLKNVPGKYWDLSPLGRNPIVDLSKVYISIEEMQFTTCTQYFISPRSRFLHAEPDATASWFLSVDSMTALECIRRGLGPDTVDIANFFINHGVRFRTFQRIRNSPDSEIPPVPPQRRHIVCRSRDHSFDQADFVIYEGLRNSFLRLEPHGPLALREGGIIARLARGVLPNRNALIGPSSKALGGHSARLVYDDKPRPEIYVEDEFSEAELRLICGTYTLANTSDNGMRIFLN